ncbi:MAG: molybdopterin synthase catalytic subunit MoaE [Burkholderiales bacterium]
MPVRIQTEDFATGEEIARLRAGNPKIGAIAAFVGLVRDVNEGDAVRELTLEHYPEMTGKALSAILDEAKQRWEVIDATIVHRIGSLKPTDQIVLVIVASSHRGDAFAACEFLMDFLKTHAPFWKKEQTGQGARWVEARESDDSAAMRWNKTPPA